MKKYSSIQRNGIFVLLFSMLLLPMLHLHPAYDHVNGEAEAHLHQAAFHADFFPEATHGHDRQVDHNQFDRDPGYHTLSQVNLFSLHVGQSLQSSSFFKRNFVALGQDPPNLSVFFQFQRGPLLQQDVPPLQNIQFSPVSLRAPPYFA